MAEPIGNCSPSAASQSAGEARRRGGLRCALSGEAGLRRTDNTADQWEAAAALGWPRSAGVFPVLGKEAGTTVIGRSVERSVQQPIRASHTQTGEARRGSCVFGGESKGEGGALRRWAGRLPNQRKAPADEHYRLTLRSPGSFGAGPAPSARGWRRLPLAGGEGARGGGVWGRSARRRGSKQLASASGRWKAVSVRGCA